MSAPRGDRPIISRTSNWASPYKFGSSVIAGATRSFVRAVHADGIDRRTVTRRRGVTGVLGDLAEDRGVLGRELKDRYGHDYDLAIWSTPEAALAGLHKLRSSDSPVVLLVACQCGADDGLELMA